MLSRTEELEENQFGAYLDAISDFVVKLTLNEIYLTCKSEQSESLPTNPLMQSTVISHLQRILQTWHDRHVRYNQNILKFILLTYLHVWTCRDLSAVVLRDYMTSSQASKKNLISMVDSGALKLEDLIAITLDLTKSSHTGVVELMLETIEELYVRRPDNTLIPFAHQLSLFLIDETELLNESVMQSISLVYARLAIIQDLKQQDDQIFQTCIVKQIPQMFQVKTPPSHRSLVTPLCGLNILVAVVNGGKNHQSFVISHPIIFESLYRWSLQNHPQIGAIEVPLKVTVWNILTVVVRDFESEKTQFIKVSDLFNLDSRIMSLYERAALSRLISSVFKRDRTIDSQRTDYNPLSLCKYWESLWTDFLHTEEVAESVPIWVTKYFGDSIISLVDSVSVSYRRLLLSMFVTRQAYRSTLRLIQESAQSNQKFAKTLLTVMFHVRQNYLDQPQGNDLARVVDCKFRITPDTENFLKEILHAWNLGTKALSIPIEHIKTFEKYQIAGFTVIFADNQ